MENTTDVAKPADSTSVSTANTAASNTDNKAGNTTNNAEAAKKKKTLILTTIAFVIVGIAVVIYWFAVLRFEQSTNDAYAQGMQVQIIAQNSGNVTEVYFDNTDLVHAGDVVVKLDDTNAKLVFENSKHELATAVRQVQILYQENIADKLTIDEAAIVLKQAKADFDHREKLNKTGALSLEAYQHSKDALELANANYNIAEQKLKINEAQLLKTALAKQPSVLAAANNVRESWIALDRTTVRSPVTGYVARRSVQIGSEVSPSLPLMVVVPLKPMWVDANFKETQLKDIRIGQPVTVTSDLYGDKVVFQGKVTGLDMGTGSAFSLLPAQNATGNWIKVVQRLPVRVDFDSDDILEKYPLRIGLSMNVTVDIKDQNGPALEPTKRKDPAFKSEVLVPNLTEVNALIDQIISDNTLSAE